MQTIKTTTRIPCPEKWNSINDFDSHRPMLYLSLLTEPTAFIEFGCGDGSTELIDWYCNTRVFSKDIKSSSYYPIHFSSFDNNKEWAFKYSKTVCVENYDVALSLSPRIDILFVDCAPAELRKEIIEKVKDFAEIIIVHDTEIGSDYVYGLKETLANFKYRVDYKPEGKPHTTAVSNVIDVTQWI